MKDFFNIAFPKFTLLFACKEHPLLLINAVPVVMVARVIDYQQVWFLLGWFFFADLVTGLLASWMEWKKSDHEERWFFGKGEGFSSDKAKKMGVKLAVYLAVPQMLINLQKTLLIKNFKYSAISEGEFELATIIVLFFCAIEGFSIFHENLPKCGVDLWGSLKKIIRLIKDVKNEITEKE